MSLLNSASLVVTPNAYKEGTLYSVIPNSTLGDMTVVRATTATRVNSAGLIELVPYNLVTYSEQFNNAAWTATNASVTSNVIISPSGVQDADLLQSIDTNAPRIRQTTTQTGNDVFTFSCFAKKGNVNFLILRNIAVNVGGGSRAWFNLDTGVIGTVNSGLTASIESVGSGWYRCSISGTTDSSPLNFIDIALSATDNTFAGAANENIYLWGAQLVAGTLPKDYLRTETRLNIPRLDYSNGSCPSLLVEPQRTNAIYTNIFTNWGKLSGGESITSGIVDPSGQTQAYTLSSIPAGNFSYGLYLGVSFSVGAGSPFCYSLYLKGSGTITITAQGSGFFSPTTITLTSVWTRYNIVITPANAQTGIAFYISNSSGTTATSVDIAFPQAELGSYPTSYIPTTSAAVTRNADVISKTGISSLIGQTEGVLFLDLFASAKNDDTNTYGTWLVAGTATENFQIYNLGSTLYWYVRLTTGGAIIDQTANQTIVEGTRYKIAIAYKSGDYALYINGVQKRTSANANVPAVSQFNLSAGGYGAAPAVVKNEYNSVVLFPTRLTNAELAQLTTL